MLRDKLGRMSGHIVRPQKSPLCHPANRRYIHLADFLHGEVCSASNGTYIEIITDFPATYSHGPATLLEALDSVSFLNEHFQYGAAGLLSLKKLLFFDMETTGLGGSGTVPFLIGCGSLTADGFQVRQYFLPDYPDEAAMLEAVRAEIKEDAIIVSYNGRTFDMPIFTDRLILHRIERNLAPAGHIDLLHSVRKIYRRRLKDCSLGNVEREILGYFRYDDIPGSLVPSVYFHWLATEEMSELARVLRHNVDDIVSLFFIMHNISEVMSNPIQNLGDPEDILSLAKILERRHENELLHKLLEEFHEIVWQRRRHDILMLHSLCCKRSNMWPKAVEIWEKIAQTDSPEAGLARIELAKYCEHRKKDMAAALHHAQSALETYRDDLRSMAALEKRLSRLQKKLSR
jgi:uncharacterized protein YprB with RNaseH-like and TPR domain